MDWREYIESVYASNPRQQEFPQQPDFRSPALQEDIQSAESILNVLIPDELKELLLQTNGVMTRYKSIDVWRDDIWLIYRLEEIIDENKTCRETLSKDWERDFEQMLVFARAGADGILFAHPRLPNGNFSSEVISWEPIGDEVKLLAPNLAAFIKGWTQGTLSV